MPQSIAGRIRNFLGAVMASLFPLGCFCVQADLFSLSMEKAELAGKHGSGLSSAKDEARGLSRPPQNLRQKKNGNGNYRQSDESCIQGKRNGGHSCRRSLFEPYPPDALCLVPIAIRMRRMASGDTSTVIFSDYHKQSFARAGPGNSLVV